MSSKPATPPASRAAVPGAPRVLVYVADQRQLEAPPSPHDPHYRRDFPAFAGDDRAGLEEARLYRPVNENGAYGVPDNPALRGDYFAVSGSFIKNHSIKIEDSKPDTNPIALGNFHSQVEDSSDLQLYQMRCPSGRAVVTQLRASNALQSFMSDDLHNVSENNKDYGCVNYQFVDQSVTHQGSSVSDQVSVRVEGEVGGLAHIAVPLGWKRILSGASVLYISPSGTVLSTLSQLREYLQTAGTCKCGLPCPLRPENTFSFDPKVASKPYQTPTGSELAKLCNHKRKLLASLNARANATPPPQPDKKGGDMAVLVKKMKRPTPQMTNQLIVQKEKSITEYKVYQQQQQECAEQMRTGSPVVQMRINSQSCPPAFNTPPHLAANILAVSETNEIHKTDFQIQRTSSHYLTVNSGWINPEPTQKPNMIQSNINLGQHVMGANGQIIGMNTSAAKGHKSIQQTEHDQKEDKKLILELCSNQSLKHDNKEEESHMFSGLNQPLTPEVIQKINEQQQIFIQQNQKQIEMAMKGYRPQMPENINTHHQGKSQCQRNYLPQGQLVIQNGTVMKTNPGKMPPWQVKSHAINHSKLHRIEDVEYDDAMINSAEDGRMGNVQPVCSRVPPLPQHYSTLTVQQWSTEPTKKKSKSKGKKKAHVAKNLNYGDNGIRVLEESKMKINNNQCNNNPIPSFMDDPNGYLAQQTALLNNTISRQVGINNSYEHGVFDNPTGNFTGVQNEFDKNCKSNSKINDVQFRNYPVPNCLPSPNRTPDSSDKISDQCTRGCNSSAKIFCAEHYQQNVMRRNFSRQQYNTMEFGGPCGIPNKCVEDSPVTSSTLMDREEAAIVERIQEGSQMMHFISNHNINKNLMDTDNVSHLGGRKRLNAMPGYCPPPHLGGGPPATLVQASYVQSCGVGTFAGGLSVTRNTFTSVLAGRARTSTTSINAASPNFIRPPPPPSVDLATSYAIPTNRPDPFINSVNLPTSYPLHIAGTTAQSMISKSPLEMMQNVIGNSTGKHDPSSHLEKKTNNQILISSTKQIVISNGTPMPPPPPKSTSSGVLLNTLPAPFVLPSVMVDGQGMQQLVGGLVASGPSPAASPRQMQGMALLSPEGVTKKSKKKKSHSATNVLQITANQQNSNIVVHHTSPQHNTSPQFSPRGFQLSPNNNLNSAPVLQALTIVPGKSGAPHIVMGGQGTPNGFGSQQIISNTSPTQQINLLQPVNLLNSPAGVVSNFPTFPQFLVPNLGGMVMTADGTIIQDNSTGVQLQLQTVNGQNVLTPVQNFSGANTGVVIRAQNQQGKIIQSQHSPQFLSPNFNSQLSPLLANISPNSLGGYGGNLSPRGRTVSTQTLGVRGGKSPSASPAAAGCSPPDTTTLSPLGPLDAASPRRIPTADTTTKSPEPNDSNSLAMVQCVSSSEQDMVEQSDHSSWPAMPVEFTAESETQNAMSNMQIVRNSRGYNQTISVTSVNNQHSLTITPGGYYDRGLKRKQETPQTQHKVPRTSYPLPPVPSDYDQPNPYDQPSPYDTNPPNFPSLDRHNDPSGLDKFVAGDVVWGPYGGHAWWPAQLMGARGGRWDVRWFGGNRGSTVLPARRLLSLTQGLEYIAATRAGRRKSRKLNIHLENAIQEAMAELDKTSEQSSESSDPTPKPCSSEVPKKLAKKQAGRSKIVKKNKTGKMSSSSVAESPRLRNNR